MAKGRPVLGAHYGDAFFGWLRYGEGWRPREIQPLLLRGIYGYEHWKAFSWRLLGPRSIGNGMDPDRRVLGIVLVAGLCVAFTTVYESREHRPMEWLSDTPHLVDSLIMLRLWENDPSPDIHASIDFASDDTPRRKDRLVCCCWPSVPWPEG